MDIPNKFGRPKIGVCRINNCPSRGESKYIHGKTVVGGCDICVNCHKIFEKGKSPEKVYEEKLKEKQQKQKIEREESLKNEKARIELEKKRIANEQRKPNRKTEGRQSKRQIGKDYDSYKKIA